MCPYWKPQALQTTPPAKTSGQTARSGPAGTNGTVGSYGHPVFRDVALNRMCPSLMKQLMGFGGCFWGSDGLSHTVCPFFLHKDPGDSGLCRLDHLVLGCFVQHAELNLVRLRGMEWRVSQQACETRGNLYVNPNES